MEKQTNEFIDIHYVFLKFAEFRALVDYRLKYTKIKFLRYLVHPTCMHINLYISSKSEIGGGLRFMHGFSTIIYCTKWGLIAL